MGLSLRQVEVWVKYGEREHAAGLIDRAVSAGWIHLGDPRARERLMRQWQDAERGTPARRLPAGIDLAALSEKARRAYRAYYGEP